MEFIVFFLKWITVGFFVTLISEMRINVPFTRYQRLFFLVAWPILIIGYVIAGTNPDE